MEQKHPLAGLSFPLSPGEFFAHQETVCGVELTADQKELIAAWLDSINAFYEAGRNGEDTQQDYQAMRGLIEKSDGAVRRFLESALEWMKYAERRGVASRNN